LFTHAGVCYAKMGHYDDAKTYLDQGVKLASERSMPFFLRGCLLMHREKWADALKDFDRALEREPLAASVWNNKSGCLLNLGDLLGSEKSLVKALEIDPANTLFLENLAKVYIQENEFGTALECLTKSIRLKRNDGVWDSELFLYAAACYRKRKEYARAMKAAKRVLKRDSNNGQAYEELGDILMEMPVRRYLLAAIDYTEALKRLKEPSIINKLASVVEASKVLGEAKHVITSAQHGKITSDELVQEMERIFFEIKQKAEGEK